VDDDGRIKIVENEVNNLKKEFEDQKKITERLQSAVSKLDKGFVKVDTYVSQIFSMLDEIKTNIKFLTTQRESDKEKNNERWLELFKKALYLIAGGVITYIAYRWKIIAS
jgi:septal ring factor EnvC (AmiA/AmiB activator)